MPRGDGTGPDGRGGWCTPRWMSRQIDKPQSPVRGFRGRARGRGNMFYARRMNPIKYPPTNQGIVDEESLLEKQEEVICRQLDRIRRRLDDLRNRE
ncbi:MAG: hypothetical protein GF334_00835 [Candidatus Altiarchaeales archaeon]|nr:hypothetical protein [Candidatus Altiarchaeales archaeon]